jgi:non-specific serine/threonine protein kinase
MTLEPVLTPHGLLTLRETGEALALEPEQGLRLEKAFARGSGHGLLWLGASEVGTALPPVLSYWRELGVRYVTALCAVPGIGEGKAKPPVPIPGDGEFDTIAVAVPPMIGAEYLTADVFLRLTRPHFRLRPRPSICRSARPCRSTPVRETESVCCRC